MRDWSDWVMAGVALIAVTLLGLTIYASILCQTVKLQCLALGYPDGILGGASGYCVARIDNSDVVVPLAEAKKR